MSTGDSLLEAFLITMEDEHVSRAERKALRALLQDEAPGPERRASLRAGLFDHLERRLGRDDAKRLRALEAAVSLLYPAHQAATRPSRVWFGPEDEMSETLCTLIGGCRERLDVAVFTITDNRVAGELVQAFRRGVAVRILTDDDKASDRGSDVVELARAGIPVRFDQSPHHFHHKYAVFDGRSALTGSYNWTRGAAEKNRENFLLTWEPAAVQAYAAAFDRLWLELAPRSASDRPG